MRTAILLLSACVIGMSFAQFRPPPDGSRTPPPDGVRTPPPGFTFATFERPLELDPASQCGHPERRCRANETCTFRRREDTIIAICVPNLMEGGSCARRDFIEGSRENFDDRIVDDRMFNPEIIDRKKAVGAGDRDTARNIHGAIERLPCIAGLNCMEDVCMRREQTECDRRRMENRMVRCEEEDGSFSPTQCRRLPGETDSRVPPTALNCFCANPNSGDMVPNTMRRVRRREEVPDCTTRSFRRCSVMRDGRRVSLRHGESTPQRQNERCMACRCNNGTLMCRPQEGGEERCPRSDPNVAPRNCMMDGEMVRHGERRQDGDCNMCGCRNGEFRCTRIPECRGEDSDEGRGMEDMRCDECRSMMANRPVCAVREGRTFPTRCHAMRCQGHEEADVEDGPCSERDSCSMEERCGATFSCMQREPETRMSIERAAPEDRRLCVNREETHCLPTETLSDGRMRLDFEDRDDPIEALEEVVEEDDDDDDRSVCASDGNTYPSTCHMITQSGDMIPRVRYTGECRRQSNDEEEREMRMVCATDGVTYENMRHMRTQGGNVRMDYMGRCDDPDSTEDDTHEGRCRMARESDRCPRLTNCTRRFMPSDGCCPVCGSAVVMAIDQEALDEHVRTTGDLADADDFMGRFLRDQGDDREPIIRPEALRRCNVSMTRPTTTPGSQAEVMFRARNMSRDAGYCHLQAMRMMNIMNQDSDTAVSTAQSLVAAATVAPELTEEEGPTDGAPAFAASCVMLIAAFLAALAA